jgi:hypothetical protein
MRIATGVIVGAILLVFATGCTTLPPPDRTGQLRVPWVLTGGDDHSLQLSAMVMGTDCQRWNGVDVIESEEAVEIRAWVTEVGANGCFAVRRYEQVDVALGSPLGLRTLVGCMIEDSAPHDTRQTCAEVVDI